MPPISVAVPVLLASLCACPGLAGAADASWVSAKVLEGGSPSTCGYGYPDYRIEIKGTTFTSAPVGGSSSEASSTTLNIKALQPDGSGRITNKNRAGKTWNYDFDAGAGPRKVRYGNDFSACRYAWVPK
jgi:hypothetical protein